MAGRPTNAAKTRMENLARAQQAKLEARKTPPDSPPHAGTTENGEADNESSRDNDIECTGWSGGVSHYVSSDDEPIIISGDDSEDDEEVEELSGSELEELMGRQLKTPEVTSQPSAELNTYSKIMHQRTQGDWKKAESRRSLGYNKLSTRTKRYHEQVAREKAREDAKLRNRWVGFE